MVTTFQGNSGVTHTVKNYYPDDPGIGGIKIVTRCGRHYNLVKDTFDDYVSMGSRQPDCMACIANET